MTQVITNK